MIYFLKQAAAVLAAPLTLALLVCIVGIALRGFDRRRAALWIFIAAALLAYAGATPLVGNVLLGPLERAYAPLPERTSVLSDVRHIVVLGSGYAPHANIPVTAAMDEEGIVRIVEGVRLAYRMETVRLILSGGARPGGTPSAQAYFEIARSLGIEQNSLVILDSPRDTHAEAVAIADLLHAKPFILVTSAYHMSRAVRLMRLYGARPIPAPTGQSVQSLAGTSWHQLLPSSAGLRKTERALHEYIALAAMSIGLQSSETLQSRL